MIYTDTHATQGHQLDYKRVNPSGPCTIDSSVTKSKQLEQVKQLLYFANSSKMKITVALLVILGTLHLNEGNLILFYFA